MAGGRPALPAVTSLTYEPKPEDDFYRCLTDAIEYDLSYSVQWESMPVPDAEGGEVECTVPQVEMEDKEKEERINAGILELLSGRDERELRGMEVSEISVEKMNREKAEKISEDAKIRRWTLTGVGVYLLFFGLLFKILAPATEFLQKIGLGIQAVIVTFIMLGINTFIRKYREKLPLLQNRALAQMLQVYALICIIIVLVTLNDIPKGLLLPAL